MWQHSGEVSGPKARLVRGHCSSICCSVCQPELSSSSGTEQSSDHVTCARGIFTCFECCGVLFELRRFASVFKYLQFAVLCFHSSKCLHLYFCLVDDPAGLYYFWYNWSLSYWPPVILFYFRNGLLSTGNAEWCMITIRILDNIAGGRRRVVANVTWDEVNRNTEYPVECSVMSWSEKQSSRLVSSLISWTVTQGSLILMTMIRKYTVLDCYGVSAVSVYGVIWRMTTL